MRSPFQTKRMVCAFIILFFLVNVCPLCALTDGETGGGRLRAIIEDYVAQTMSLPASSVRVELEGKMPYATALAEQKISCKVEKRGGDDLLGSVRFAVRYYEEGNCIREETVKARVEVLMDAIVATRPLLRDAEIVNDDVRLIKKWVVRVPADAATNLEEVIGKRLRTSVRPYTEIAQRMLRDAVLVKRGKAVKIELDSGSLYVTTMGTCEEDGALGSLIKVKNVTSNRIIWAKVVGDSLVRVDF